MLAGISHSATGGLLVQTDQPPGCVLYTRRSALSVQRPRSQQAGVSTFGRRTAYQQRDPSHDNLTRRFAPLRRKQKRGLHAF